MQVMRQASKRKSGLRSWSRALGIAVFALVFTASHAWAAPFTGADRLDWIFIAAPTESDPNASIFSATVSGFTSAFGSYTCTEIVFETVVEPFIECGEDTAFDSSGRSRGFCRFEGTEDNLNYSAEGTSCIPTSCLDENGLLQIDGCVYSGQTVATVEGGTGVWEGASGSWTISTTGTYAQFSPDITGSISRTIQGDIELADGVVVPAGATLEIPSPGTNVSGVGLISGWSCLGGELKVEFSDADGVIETMTVLQGAERLDTESVCGDIDNGFSATYNWSRLGSGEKTARLIRNGEEVASQTFMVTAFDTEFVTGAEGMCTIADFPDMGKNATFVWEQSQQGLVLESVN